MSFLTAIPILGSVIEKVLDRTLPDKSESAKAQNKLNEIELGGAPASRLRLWRSFLGWVLAIVFAFEIVGRPLLATYFPQIELPPTVIEEISKLLFALLGLGF